MAIAYLVRDAADSTLNAHFAVYDSGIVRHVGGIEAGQLLSGRLGVAPKLIAETDKSALADLYRDSGTWLRPAWAGEIANFETAPYTGWATRR